MTLHSGFKIGSYEIVCSLGVGGMGEVYRAKDSKLKRDVALKVLPADVAGDRERLARFQREAEVLASLNHPHIAHIHGLEESTGTTALVMELVEGEDLAQRIAHGPIPLDEALPIATQIAEALEAAHNAGIVHRDLKPANIKIRPDGTVKVLDFGLAKAVDSTQYAGRNLANSPTITSPMTMHGAILGTAAYMSPEQAKGKAVDKRADVWAFGVVLYEMLMGAPLFQREDLTETLAAVLTRDPDLDQLPRTTPESIRRLLVRCLAKDPRRRLDSMRAAWLDIEDAARHPPTATTPAEGRRHVAVVAAIVAVLAAATGWTVGRLGPRAVTTPGSDSPIVAEIPAPPGVLSAFYDGFALSPDAATLAFIARNSEGRGQLWLRKIDSAVAQPVPGTEGAQYPFWSPDGAHVAYFGNGKLARVPIGGGPPQSLADAASVASIGTWSEHDEILFDMGFGTTGLNLVPAQGGPVRALDVKGRHPAWLPGGRQFLFRSVGRERSELLVATVDSAANGSGVTAIGQAGPDNEFVYSSSGHVFLNRNGTLIVQRFDAASRALQGTPAVLAGAVGTPRGWLALSATADTVVALARRSPNELGDAGDPVARLQWVSRAGTRLEDAGPPARYWVNSVAPDGRRVATHQGDDVWILGGRAPTRLRTRSFLANIIWSSDGTEIAYAQANGAIVKKAIDRDTPEERIATINGLTDVDDWSRDGRFLLGHVRAPSGFDVVLFDRETQSSRPVLSGPASEQQARFSPDGRWLAYQSDASARPEVYITAIAGRQNPIQVSVGGGMHPIWRGDGNEIYYLDPDGAITMVPVTTATGTLSVGAATRLFRIPLNDITLGFVSPFDVSQDGQRFLLNVPDAPSPLLYIRGFQRLLK